MSIYMINFIKIINIGNQYIVINLAEIVKVCFRTFCWYLEPIGQSSRHNSFIDSTLAFEAKDAKDKFQYKCQHWNEITFR